MKRTWIKLCKWLLGVLGVSASIASCDGPIGGFMRTEYGQPNMDFSVKGKVVDSKTGAGVAGIEVSHDQWGKQIDTTATDGSFEISGNTFPINPFNINLKDIDPDKDGHFKDTQVTVDLKQVKKGSGSWYSGEFEATDTVLKMDRQDNE